MADNFDYLVKILLIGESGVGKTCILQQFIENKFINSHLPTIAIDFRMKVLYLNGVKLKMQLWDTAGQERFNTLTSGFFKCVLISFSWSDSNLFYNRQRFFFFSKQVDGVNQEFRTEKCKSNFGGKQN